MQPTLLFGKGGGAAVGGNSLYRASAAASDDAGVPFNIRARSDRFYPAGPGGEAIFTAVWLTVTTAITPAAAISGTGADDLFTRTDGLSWVADAMIGKHVSFYAGTALVDHFLVTDNDATTLTFDGDATGATKIFANAVDLILTPYVDGVALPTQTLTITGPTSGAQTRLTAKYEFGLSVPYPSPIAEAFRTAARGASFEVQVATSGGVVAGELIAVQADVEYEVVRESVAALSL
jgi:hypothetical protein